MLSIVVIVFDVVLFIQHYFVYNLDRKIKKNYEKMILEKDSKDSKDSN
jgi:cbb3-type cytochrome oxidase subunit 3